MKRSTKSTTKTGRKPVTKATKRTAVDRPIPYALPKRTAAVAAPRDYAAELREREIPRSTHEIETQETHVLRYSKVWGHERETDRSVGDLLSAMFNSGAYDADDLGPGMLSFVGSFLDLLRDAAEFVDGGITDSKMLVYIDQAQSFAENGAELVRRFNAAREVGRRPAKGAA